MNERVYKVNYKRLVFWLLPPLMARSKSPRWLRCLIKPVVTLYQVFLRYRTYKLYQLTITPQVCYLERLLNDKYDYVERRIYIDDPVERLPLYIFQEEELKPVFVFQESEDLPKWIYTEGEAGYLQDDFIIFAPLALVFSNAEMLELVKGYRLAGMKAKIQRF